MLINELFKENKFRLFVKYCNNHGIVTIHDISQIDFEDLANVRGIGNKKIEDIKERIKSIQRSNTDVFEYCICEAYPKEIPLEEMEIKDLFAENKYNLFLQYCKQNGFEKIQDLQTLDLIELSATKGFGKKKIDDIVLKIKELPQYVINLKNSYNSFDKVSDEIKVMDIFALTEMGVSKQALRKLQGKGVYTLEDLVKTKEFTIVQEIGRGNLNKVKKAVEILSDSSLIDALAIVLEKSRAEDVFKIVVEREEGATLHAIGEKYNLTKERIRQKIEKYLNRISPYMKALTSELLKDKGYFSIDQLLDIYDDDDYDRIVTHWCKNYELLEYISFARVFVMPKTNRLSEKDEIVRKILQLVNEGCRCDDLIANLEFDVTDAGYAYMNMDAIYELLKENGFTIQGEYIFKEKESYSQICSWIVRDYFPKGIKLYNNQELNKLRDLVKIHVGGNINLPKDDKSLSARLSERLVLADRGYAIAKEHITIDVTLLEDIKKYIDNIITSKQVYYSEIFERFKDKLINSGNVNNHHFLHGALLEYFPKDYEYARDYLVKKDGAYIFEDIATRINQYIVRHGKAIKKSQITKEFPGISDAMLLGVIQSNEKLIQWEPNVINSLDIIKITHEDYKKLENLLAVGTKNNGYCSENKLFTILKDIDCDFASKYEINKASHLFGLCDKLFENQYNFKRPHISSKNIEGIDSFKDIVNYLLGDSEIMSYTEFNAISKANEWSPVSVGMVFTELENDYYRISKDLYVKKEAFTLTDVEKEAIYQNILNLMSNGIFSLLGFNNWEGFPKLKYDWNEFLLATIVKNFIDGVKMIYPNYTDRRIEKGIVVLNEMSIDDYEGMIEYWLRYNNIISIPENELLKKMMQCKLTYKVIPKEIYDSKRIKLQNGIFTIEEKQSL